MNVPDTHPLLLSNLIGKAQASSDAYLRASVGVMEGYGMKGAKARPFRQDIAVRRFSDWVYAASLLVAQAIASNSLRLYMRRRPGKRPAFGTRSVSRRAKTYMRGDAAERPSRSVLAKMADFGDDYEEVTEPHPTLKVLAAANPWQNGFELTTLRFLYLQLSGNAYIHPVFDEELGIPAELWLMPSQWMQVIPGKREENVLISGWLYGRPGTEHPFAPDEVIQWRLPSVAGQQSETDVLYYGKGKAEAAWSSLNLHDAKRVQDQARYDNFSRPDWLVGVEGATGAALKELELSIEQRLRGVHNTGKMLATNGKVTAQALNLPDPEVGDSDKIVQEIASIFGVPLYKLLGNDPVKANSDVQDSGFLRDTILPYLRLDEEQLNAKYLPLFGIEDDAVLAYDNPIPENKAAEVDRRTKLVVSGIMMPNEARAEEGLEDAEGGDVLFVPATSVPITMAGQQVASPIAGAFSSLFGTAPTATSPPTTPAPASQPQPAAGILTAEMIDLALKVVEQVTAGTLLRDSGLALMESAGIPADKAKAIMGSAGTAKPAQPNPVATAEGDVSDGGGAGAGPVALNGAQITALADVLNKLTIGQLVGPVAVEMVVALGLPRETADQMVADTLGAKKPDPPPVQPTATAEPDPAAGPAPQQDTEAAKCKTIKAVYAEPPPDGSELTPILRDIFARQRTELMAAMGRKAVVTKDEDGSLPTDLSHWDKPLADAVQPGMERIARAGVNGIRSQLSAAGVPDAVFEVVDRNLPRAVDEAAMKFAQSTNATTAMEIDAARAALREQVREGIVTGDTVAEMRGRVQTVFERATDSRAETIARTEATRVRHAAERMTAKESGVVQSKRWMVSADACPLCIAIAAKAGDGIPLDQAFGSDSYGEIQGPPAHPNCTCSQELVV